LLAPADLGDYYMNVLIISTEFPPLIGGISTFTLNIANGLEAEGSMVRVLTSVASREKIYIPRVRVLRTFQLLNKKILKLFPLAFLALVACIRERPDVIIAMVWTHEGVVAYLIKRLLGISYAVVSHGGEIVNSHQCRLRHKAMCLILKQSSCVFANSEFTKGLVVKSTGSNSDHISVVNPSVMMPVLVTAEDLSKIDSRFNIGNRRIIFTAARLVRRKGHAQIIIALETLAKKYPDLVFVMTGDGVYRVELEALSRRHHVADRVIMTGFVSDEELHQLFQRAEVYVSPSDDDNGDVEGFGIALLEASAYGKPVIAGRSGGVAEAVVDGVTGFLVDPLNIDEITQRISEILDDANLRNRLGESGRLRALADFGIRGQGRKIDFSLRQALNGTLL
jgi:phosphatidylinositol alpha-1,6-mannosyltransferase